MKFEKILRGIMAILVFGFGFWVCDGTWWRELVFAMILILGSDIQNG